MSATTAASHGSRVRGGLRPGWPGSDYSGGRIDGRTCEHIPMPDAMTTNICFGGSDLRTAYITLATSGKLVSMQWQCPGLGLNFLNK